MNEQQVSPADLVMIIGQQTVEIRVLTMQLAARDAKIKELTPPEPQTATTLEVVK